MSEEATAPAYPFYMFSVITNKATHVGSTLTNVVADDATLDQAVEYAKREAAHIVKVNNEKFVSLAITDQGEVVKEFDSLEQ